MQSGSPLGAKVAQIAARISLEKDSIIELMFPGSVSYLALLVAKVFDVDLGTTALCELVK